MLGALAGLLVVAAPILIVLLQERDNRRAILSRILPRIDGQLESSGGLLRDVVTGRHADRAFRITIGTRKGLRLPTVRRHGLVTDVFPLEVELELRHAPAIGLRVRRDEGLAAVEKALGLVRDVEVARGAAFDEKFLVEVSGGAGAPLASSDVRREVERLLLEWALDEVAIKDGKLLIRGSPETLGRKELNRLLDAVEVLAHAFDRRPALEIGLAERFVWVGGEGQLPRCPYCHDGLERAQGLSSCGSCRTMIHAECHRENGGCPILGCGGRAAEAVGGGRDPKASAGLDLA